jgi:hypothetical protein
MKKFSIAPLLFIPILACGGDDGGHHITTPDSNQGSGSGSGSGSAAPCTAAATYGSDFGSADDQLADWSNGSGSATAAPGVFEEWEAALNGDFDVLALELYRNSGIITNIMPGTYPIMGDDANYKTCGVCVRIYTNETMTDYADDYLATSGVVTISTVGGAGTGSGSDRTYGTLSGSFQNLKLEHVMIAPSPDFTSTVVGDCSAMLVSGDFSAVIEYGGSNATPPAAPSLRVHWDNGAPALRGRHK